MSRRRATAPSRVGAVAPSLRLSPDASHVQAVAATVAPLTTLPSSPTASAGHPRLIPRSRGWPAISCTREQVLGIPYGAAEHDERWPALGLPPAVESADGDAEVVGEVGDGQKD